MEPKVVAIIAAFNEADVIGSVVSDLIQHGIDVYLLDDGSVDSTVSVVQPFLGRGLIAIERLTAAPPGTATDRVPRPFAWEAVLRRKSELAASLEADWFIHHDADEFRESPWPGVSLREAIRRVDGLGYNAIDFASLDFRPTADTYRPGDDPREVMPYYAINPHDRLQIRCWKKSSATVDLVSTGGHEARFPGRAVFPLRFILRHYPIRSQAHGERKVFQERQGRFLPSERARGWHVQYEGIEAGHRFVQDPSTLRRYDPDAVRIELALHHRGVEELEQSVAAAEEQAHRVATLLGERDRGIAWLRELNDERERGIAWLREVVASLQNTVAAQERGIAWLRESLAQRERELADANGRLESLTAEVSRLRRCTAGEAESSSVAHTDRKDAVSGTDMTDTVESGRERRS